MKNIFFVALFLLPLLLPAQIDLSKLDHKAGYFDYWYDEGSGKVYLKVDKLNQDFLYNHALSAGVGSNDLGLDRGQLGGAHVVRFEKHGHKILLIEDNLDYRAVSENQEEVKAVNEAFAESVWGAFPIQETTSSDIIIDISPLLLADAHGIANRLKNAQQGNYRLASDRSVIYTERCKNFPKNSEFEALLTFTGEAKGRHIRSVTPTAGVVSVRLHHSFIELPDDNYKPRRFDPNAGYSVMRYADYATSIDQPLVQRFIRRHRLEKKDPNAALSEAVEPIVYYLDRGAPEPIKSALMEGARWWNQAFEAAGFKDAFIVKEMPEGADPLDVRYNVIQWVHRSTRGWSYGSSVSDPRTGEIIKGHVSLGSLRVRQDFLIAKGLRAIYTNGNTDDSPLVEMALARLRQLSAHEVGHTIGLAHNYSSSADGRTSVMDYPHPYILRDGDALDLSQSYDDKIGAWDKRSVMYGYSQFADEASEKEGLAAILAENRTLGLSFISDRDARAVDGAHPKAHLWDNGASAIDEMQRLLALRAQALAGFSEDNIENGTPIAELEKVLVPLYYGHRYQMEAVSKLIGGLDYRYAIKGEGDYASKVVDAGVQQKALTSLLDALSPEILSIPESIIQLLLPMPLGYNKDRESFKSKTGQTFDPVSAATALSDYCFRFLLNPARLNRLQEQAARGYTFDVTALLNQTNTKLYSYINSSENLEALIAQSVYARYVEHLLNLAAEDDLPIVLKGNVLQQIALIHEQLRGFAGVNPFSSGIIHQIELYYKNPDSFEGVPSLPLPDGSPIGCY